MNNFYIVIQRIAKNPISFVVRQVYKVVVILPCVGIFSICAWLARYKVHPQSGKPKSPYCVVVTSVIYPKQQKSVSYGGVRSIYSPEDRADQTVETIQSIREHLPSAKIVLVEGGLQDMRDRFAPLVDQYEYMGKDAIVRFACDGTSKSLGEATMLVRLLSRINFDAAYYLKLSGRYLLNENFIENDWSREGFSFLCIRPDYYSTRLYGVHRKFYTDWKYILLKGWAYHLIDYPVENTMSRFVPKRFLVSLSKLGVSGKGGSSLDIIKE